MLQFSAKTPNQILLCLFLFASFTESSKQPTATLRPMAKLSTLRPTFAPPSLHSKASAQPTPTQALVSLRTQEELPVASVLSTNLFREPSYLQWAESLQPGDGTSERLLPCNLNSAILALDTNTGALTLKQRLDREALLPGRRPDFVSATDRVVCDGGALKKAGGEGSGDDCFVENTCMAMRGNQLHALTVRLFVEDMNDNAPTWHLGNGDQVIEVVENTLLSVRIAPASDPDNGPNGTVRYMIHTLSNESRFSIVECAPKGNCGGALTVISSSPFDYEEAHEHELMVIASDEGSPPLTSSARVRIHIIDQNDNSPKFSQSLLVLNEPEDSVPRKFLTRFFADDADALDRDRGTLFYRLVPGSNFQSLASHSAQQHSTGELFAVDTVDGVGELFLVGQLDFERQKHHVLLVEALDSGRRHTASMTIQVHLLIN